MLGMMCDEGSLSRTDGGGSALALGGNRVAYTDDFMVL